MSAPLRASLNLTDASVAQARTAVTTVCRCRHFSVSHAGGVGPCQRTLPAIEDEELPEWRCPCHHFSPWLPS